MEEQHTARRRTPRKKSQFEIFKEEKLPKIILIAAAVLIVIFIIGSISNAIARNQLQDSRNASAAQQAQREKKALDTQVSDLLQNASSLAQQYDYEGALAVLDPVTRHAASYPDLKAAIAEYNDAKQSLVCWDDPAKIPNLSFQMLDRKSVV